MELKKYPKQELYKILVFNIKNNCLFDQEINQFRKCFNSILTYDDLLLDDEKRLKLFLELEVYRQLNDGETGYSYYLFDDFLIEYENHDINEDFFFEVYDALEAIVESEFQEDIIRNKNKITAKLNGLTQKESKLKFLENEIEIIWEYENDDFLLFMQEIDFLYGGGSTNWKEHIIDTFDEKLLVYYLISDKNDLLIEDLDFLDGLFQKWIEYYSKRELLNFCKSKYNEIVNENTQIKQIFYSNISKNEFRNMSSEQKQLSKLIFIKDGEKLFFLIRDKYDEIKNRSFYSYLYHYLRINKKLTASSGYDDNSNYRLFVLSLNDIDFFNRIQKIDTSIENKKTHRVFEKLNEYLENYIQ